MASVALSPLVTQLTTTSSAASAQPKRALDRCIELLDPRAVAKYENAAYWKDVAGKAVIVGFFALYVGSLATAVIYAPLYLAIGGYFTIAMVGVTILAITVAEYVEEKCFQSSQVSSANADALKEFHRFYQELTPYAPENLQAVLIREMGIAWLSIPGMLQNPENLNTLKPLIAYYRFNVTYLQNMEGQKQSILQEAENLATANYAENREKIYDLRSQALELEKSILELKISIAFTLAAIRQPNLSKSLKDIGDFSQLSPLDGVIGNAVGSTTANTFFAFTNSALAPLTVNEVKQTSVLALSVRLLEASQ